METVKQILKNFSLYFTLLFSDIRQFNNLYKVIVEITKNENSIDTIKSTNKKSTKDILIIP